MSRPGFVFCVCPDYALIRHQVNAMAEKHPPGQNADTGMPGSAAPAKGWEQHIFWGDDGLDDKFWDSLGMQNLFGGGQLIILRNAQLILADTWKKLAKSLARANPSVWMFICLEVEFERGQPKIPAHIKRLKAFEFAEKQGWVWQNSGLSGKGMQDYIRHEAARLGLTIPPALLPRLAAIMPEDATAVRLELEKLALLFDDSKSASKPLTLEHLNLIDNPVEVDIYAVLRALEQSGQQGQRADTVWGTVLASETGASKDKMLFGFLGALTREARTMWQLLFGEKVYVPGNLAQDKLNLARQLGIRKLAELWELALESEQGVKSGEVSEEQALERLMADLSLLFQPRSSST